MESIFHIRHAYIDWFFYNHRIHSGSQHGFFAAAGAFFGTFLVMKHDEKEKIRLDASNIERNFNSQKG